MKKILHHFALFSTFALLIAAIICCTNAENAGVRKFNRLLKQLLVNYVEFPSNSAFEDSSSRREFFESEELNGLSVEMSFYNATLLLKKIEQLIVSIMPSLNMIHPKNDNYDAIITVRNNLPKLTGNMLGWQETDQWIDTRTKIEQSKEIVQLTRLLISFGAQLGYAVGARALGMQVSGQGFGVKQLEYFVVVAEHLGSKLKNEWKADEETSRPYLSAAFMTNDQREISAIKFDPIDMNNGERLYNYEVFTELNKSKELPISELLDMIKGIAVTASYQYEDTSAIKTLQIIYKAWTAQYYNFKYLPFLLNRFALGMAQRLMEFALASGFMKRDQPWKTELQRSIDALETNLSICVGGDSFKAPTEANFHYEDAIKFVTKLSAEEKQRLEHLPQMQLSALMNSMPRVQHLALMPSTSQVQNLPLMRYTPQVQKNMAFMHSAVKKDLPIEPLLMLQSAHIVREQVKEWQKMVQDMTPNNCDELIPKIFQSRGYFYKVDACRFCRHNDEAFKSALFAFSNVYVMTTDYTVMKNHMEELLYRLLDALADLENRAKTALFYNVAITQQKVMEWQENLNAITARNCQEIISSISKSMTTFYKDEKPKMYEDIEKAFADTLEAIKRANVVPRNGWIHKDNLMEMMGRIIQTLENFVHKAIEFAVVENVRVVREKVMEWKKKLNGMTEENCDDVISGIFKSKMSSFDNSNADRICRHSDPALATALDAFSLEHVLPVDSSVKKDHLMKQIEQILTALADLEQRNNHFLIRNNVALTTRRRGDRGYKC